MIRTGGRDLIDKYILHFVWFEVVQTENRVKPLAEFVHVVLALGQFNAWGTARDRSTLKCVHVGHCKGSQYFKTRSRGALQRIAVL